MPFHAGFSSYPPPASSRIRKTGRRHRMSHPGGRLPSRPVPVGSGPPALTRLISGGRRITTILAGAAVLTLGAGMASAQTSASADNPAAAVLNEVLGILSYTRWPIEPPQLQLCVIGTTA